MPDLSRQSAPTSVRRRRCVTLFAGLAAILCLVQPTLAEWKHGNKHVLILHSFDRATPYTRLQEQAIEETFKSAAGDRILLHYEYMDTALRIDPADLDELEELYFRKYEKLKLNLNLKLVLSTDTNAIEFLLDRGQALFPGIPTVFSASRSPRSASPPEGREITGVMERLDIRGTFDLILEVHPATRKIMVVADSATGSGQMLGRLARSAAAEYQSSIVFEWVQELPAADLLKRVSELPSGSIILYLSYFDRAWRMPSRTAIASAICARASVPTYAVYDAYLGQGVLGGKFASGEAQGRTAAELALRVLQGEAASSIPVVTQSPNVTMFDSNAMKRWGIVEKDLPSDSVVRFKSPSIFEEYKWQIVAGAAGLVPIQVMLIALLLVGRIREKGAVRALRDSENRLRAILDNAADGIISMDEKGTIESFNQAAEKIFGYPAQEVVGRNVSELMPTPYLEQHDGFLKTYAATGFKQIIGRRRELIGKRKDGSEFPLDLHVSEVRVGDRLLFTGMLRDITERKRAEKALQESEERYRNLFHQAPISLWEEDFSALVPWFAELRETGVGDLREYLQHHPEAVQEAAHLIRVVDVNEGTLRLFGVGSMAELLSAPLKAAEEQQGAAFSDQAFADQLIAIWEGQRRFETEFAASTPEGAHIDCLLQWVAPRAPGKLDLSYVIIAVSDITERKRAEDALRENESRLRAILDNAADGIISIDVRGTIESFNQAAEKIFGYAAQEVVGRNIRELMSSPHREQHDGFLKTYAATGFKQIIGRRRELIGKRKDGSEFPLDLHVSEVRVGDRLLFTGMLRDITERKRAEEERLELETQLRQSQKMEAVGQLAGGVAHDFNNLLTVITSGIDLARDELPPNHRADKALNLIQQAAEEAAGVTQSMLTFSRETPTERGPVDLGQAVVASSRLLRHMLPASIKLVVDTSCEPPPWINGDKTQLQQVILNLVLNARDAMPNGGTVRISVSRSLAVSSVAPREGGTACLTIKDNGSGIPAEIQSRIMEPFFTTKPRGKGTGLGLSVVHGIVESMDGKIEIESRVDQGTLISVYLPCESRAEPPGTTLAPAPPPRGRGEIVLLAEDHAQVRGIISSTLHDLGYHVVKVGDGPAILTEHERLGSELGLLIVDVDLPKQDGIDCLRCVRKNGARTPAILIAGRPDFVPDDAMDENTVLLRKPFQMAELGRLVYEMLSTHSHEELPS